MGVDTRERILEIARELFGARGYAGTSLSDIAAALGTSKAAIYYHFPSKAAILEALVASPLAAYTALADRAGSLAPAELLGEVIDTTVRARAFSQLIGNDPAVRELADKGVLRARSAEINAAIVSALAGPTGSVGTTVRARAAYVIVKEGVLAVLGDRGGLTDAERRELLAAALRALGA